MNLIKKALAYLSSQVKSSNVNIPKVLEKPHKIQDDNQSIHNGVVNEKSDSNLRSAGKTAGISKRSTKPKRQN